MRRPGFILLLLVSLALLAGCGGDDKKDETSSTAAAKTAEPPKAKQSLQAAADELSQTVASGSDCAKMFERMVPASLRGPTVNAGDPPKPEDCKNNKPLFDQVEGFKATKVQEFGPAGVVEGSGTNVSKGNVLASTWVVDQDGEWRLFTAGDFDPQIGVKPLPATNFDEVAEEFVVAARKGDCATFFKLSDPYSRFVVGTKNDEVKFCNTVAESYRKPDSALHDLAGDPNAKPEKLGETLDYGFYAVPMSSGRYWVVLIGTRSEGKIPANLAKGHPGKVNVVDYITVTRPPAKN
jgi:hypothetical protein